ncbi:MAG: 16S rRNA (uracil(1498)-N(3))-methyltransferase [Peptostreptococcaceae bacterium]|nr:16S rRNA (uracil(1498)-N(3))-methyltransferase [Peptostreptococcaceae bacterium]
MSRFFVDSSDIGTEYININDKGDIKHMTKVLRLSVGDAVDISDGVIWEYETEISEISNEEVILKITDKQHFAREPEIEICLYQGIPKAGKMGNIIQKSVELGVKKIVPVFMDRTVVLDKGKFDKKIERWQKVSSEAVKQCKRGIIPKVAINVKFKDILPELNEYDLVVFPYENENNRTIKDLLSENNPKSVAVIIGPEGGFSDNEAKSLIDNGILGVSLGKTILRTETAGPTAIAMIMYEYEI